MSSEHTLSFQLHILIYARDLEPFFKNNKLPTLCDISQLRQWVKIVFIWSNEFTC